MAHQLCPQWPITCLPRRGEDGSPSFSCIHTHTTPHTCRRGTNEIDVCLRMLIFPLACTPPQMCACTRAHATPSWQHAQPWMRQHGSAHDRARACILMAARTSGLSSVGAGRMGFAPSTGPLRCLPPMRPTSSDLAGGGCRSVCTRRCSAAAVLSLALPSAVAAAAAQAAGVAELAVGVGGLVAGCGPAGGNGGWAWGSWAGPGGAGCACGRCDSGQVTTAASYGADWEGARANKQRAPGMRVQGHACCV